MEYDRQEEEELKRVASRCEKSNFQTDEPTIDLNRQPTSKDIIIEGNMIDYSSEGSSEKSLI
jgi:hypothetical protein